MIYKIIIDEQPYTNPTSNKKTYTVVIDELRRKGDIFDSLIIRPQGGTVLGTVIRRLHLSNYGVLSVLDNPEIETFYPQGHFELNEGDNYIYIQDMEGNIISAKYIIKNYFTDTYVTERKMSTEISQTADSITSTVSSTYATKEALSTAKTEIRQTTDSISSTVSAKVGKNEIISRINQSAENVSIDAQKININGVVSANGNFQIDTSGNVSLAGNIYMTGSNTRIVGGDGLITNLQYFTSGEVGISIDNTEHTIPVGIACLVNIPSGFTVISAKLTLKHSTINWNEYTESGTIYHSGNSQNITLHVTSGMEYERTGANVDIVTPKIPDRNYAEYISSPGRFSGNATYSKDITYWVHSGLQYFYVTDYTDAGYLSSWQNANNSTGYMTMFIDIKGYMKI